MFNVVFFEPEIPPNTGNVTRLCSNTGCTLHLIEPLGFSLDDKRLRRAGLDYSEYSEIRTYRNWNDFLEKCRPKRTYAISTKGTAAYDSVDYHAGDYLLFGPETRGLPDTIREASEITAVIRIPMLPHSRSMNLSNAAAVIVYEAWRQNGYLGT
jgi:tRNA (cytidine/uridine-2'-O-)-methyltransferase